MNIKNLIEENAKAIGETEIKDILGKTGKVIDKISGPIRKVGKDIQLMIEMIRDFINGDYDETPTKTVLSLIGVLVYLLNPFDIIPDFIPVAGFLDDLLVVTTAIAMFKPDLDKYKLWRARIEQVMMESEQEKE